MLVTLSGGRSLGLRVKETSILGVFDKTEHTIKLVRRMDVTQTAEPKTVDTGDARGTVELLVLGIGSLATHHLKKVTTVEPILVAEQVSFYMRLKQIHLFDYLSY